MSNQRAQLTTSVWPLGLVLGGAATLAILTLATETAAMYDGSPTVAAFVGMAGTGVLLTVLYNLSNRGDSNE